MLRLICEVSINCLLNCLGLYNVHTIWGVVKLSLINCRNTFNIHLSKVSYFERNVRQTKNGISYNKIAISKDIT